MLFGAAAQVDSVSETKKSSATLLFWKKKEKILKLAYKAKNQVETTRFYRKNSRNKSIFTQKCDKWILQPVWYILKLWYKI